MRRRTIVLFVLLGTAAARCGPLELPPVIPFPTPLVTAPIGLPLAAFVHVVGEPNVSTDATTIRLIPESDSGGGPDFRFDVGERIAATGGTLPGLYTIAVGVVPCDGIIDLQGGLELDVIVDVSDDDSCRLIVADQHDSDQPHAIASVGGRVTGAIPGNATVRVVSLDRPPNAEPDAKEPDEGGIFSFPAVLAGRYEVSLANGTVVVDRVVLDLAAGEAASITLSMKP